MQIKKTHIKESFEDRIFNAINILIMMLVLIIIMYPLYFIVIASFSDPVQVNAGKVLILPKGMTWEGYIRMAQNEDLWRGYVNSLIYMTGGTLISLCMTIPAAYALSNKHTHGIRVFTFIFTFTMMFNGGMIPTYLVVKNLGWLNTWWILMINGGFSTYNLIVSRTFMQSIPSEVLEAAEIDGASIVQSFFRVVLPLSKPIIAVMALFYGIARWNDYFTALIYVTKQNLVPLQMVLRRILIQSETAASSISGDPESQAVLARISELMKYCVIIAASLPAMVIYPFVQKHFVKGVMLGALKG
ncbi:MAG: carbohydrate ABC transporter permease [Clostridia bacterium]|nr:carbohydrate ABC transporter permease [Clostridia bacterium]